MQNYETFQRKGGFFELNVHLFSLSGERAGSFLHGQLTNHIVRLENGEGNYNLLLNPKGKILGDLYVLRREDLFYLIIHGALSEKIVSILNKSAPLSHVTIFEEAEKNFYAHICFPSAEILRGTYLFDIIGKKYAVSSLQIGGLVIPCFRSDRLGIPGFDLFIRPHHKKEVISYLEQKGLIRVDYDLKEILRVETGTCLYGSDATEDNFPQESRLDHALHFDKGCYVGQEIIARVHYRGHINNILGGFRLHTKHPVEKGTIIFDDKTNQVGVVTSSVFSPLVNSVVALGHITYSMHAIGRIVYIGDELIKASIIELPLKIL